MAPYVSFGVMLGLAGASKINALAIALLLPLAVLLKDPKSFLRPSSLIWTRRFHFMLAAAIISFITFRIFQPYAFQGPGFLNIGLNKEWISDPAGIERAQLRHQQLPALHAVGATFASGFR